MKMKMQIDAVYIAAQGSRLFLRVVGAINLAESLEILPESAFI